MRYAVVAGFTLIDLMLFAATLKGFLPFTPTAIGIGFSALAMFGVLYNDPH